MMYYWLAVDREDTELIFIYKDNKPIRNDKDGIWEGKSCGTLDRVEYPNLTWEMEPILITISI